MNLIDADNNNVSSDKDDYFRKTFKYYKSNKPKPCLKEVLSVDSCCTDKVINIIVENVKEDSRAELLGLRNVKQWKLFAFQKHQGLFLIKNPFTSLGQRFWIRKCLETYPKKPNKINIDIEMPLQDWWEHCFENGQCNRSLLKKLRWATLGYHHNWDTKVYSDENKSIFPGELAELSDVVAHYLCYGSFKAEAAIVNYYHMDSTLSAHTDHSEINLEAPLFSFSFGQSAIFLIGGTDKNIKPSAIFLNSGDIVVMSKEARLCYHAVPKILFSKSTPWNNKDDLQLINSNTSNFKYISNLKEVISSMNKNVNNEEWIKFNSYIQESRINMNVRQVLNENQTNLREFH